MYTKLWSKDRWLFNVSDEIETRLPYYGSFSMFWNIYGSLCTQVFCSWMTSWLKIILSHLFAYQMRYSQLLSMLLIILLLFLVSSCLVMAVEPCVEWIPIKKYVYGSNISNRTHKIARNYKTLLGKDFSETSIQTP